MIALLNLSPDLNKYQTDLLCWGVQRQVREHFCPAWGLTPRQLKVYTTLEAVPVGSWLITIMQDSTVAGALGFHDLTPDGRPYGRVFTRGVATVSTGADSISSILSHEVLETVLDPNCQLWADDGKGTAWAYEAADATEEQSYDMVYGSTKVAVSNFVLPPFFSPNPPPGSRFDFMGLLTIAFSLAPGGYSITEKEGVVSQITGRKAERSMQRHDASFPASRSFRRLHRKAA